MSSDIPEESYYTYLWRDSLIAISLVNVVAYICLFVTSKHVEQATSTGSRFWDFLWRKRHWLTLVYVIACAVRSVYPRMDGDRVCVVDHMLSPPLIGRSLAFVAEVCYMALICATMTRVINTPFSQLLSSVMLALNVVAQLACTHSVLTRNQRGHVLEESIWTLSAISFVLFSAYCYVARGEGSETAVMTSTSCQASVFLRGMLLLGSIYIIFMVLVDVPMYLERVEVDNRAGTTFLSLKEGLFDISRCAVISTADSYWVKEMPWQTGYFSAGVWTALWMGLYSQIDVASSPKKVL